MERLRSPDRPGRRAAVALCAALVLLAGLLAAAAQPPFPSAGPREAPRGPLRGHRHLIFANTYHTRDRADKEDDYLVLGHYDFAEGQHAVAHYWTYEGAKNTKAMAATVRNPRLQAGRGGPRPGPVHLPGYTAFTELRGTWTADRHMIRVRFGNVIHDWVRRDRSEGLYVLAGPYTSALDASHTVDGLTFSNGHGYAYPADHVKLGRRLRTDELLPDYDGEMYVRKEEGDRGFRWVEQGEALHVKRYREFRGGDLLARAEVDNSLNPPMLWQSTLLLNYAPYSNLLLYMNGSHDFNKNGVFDEVGHTLQLYGVFAGGKVRHMVFVEFSHQDNGRPIMGVGRYDAPGRPQEPLPPPRVP